MPWLVGVIMSALSGAVGLVIARVLTGLGIAFVGYQGLDAAFGEAQAAIFAALDGTAADVLAVLKIMGIYTAVKIYLAAWGAAVSTRLAFRVVRFKA